MISQTNVIVIIGLLAELPAASGVPRLGTFFYATDTTTYYILRSVNGVPTWSIISASGTPGLPGQNNAYLGGSIVTPVVKVANFTAGGIAGAEFASAYQAGAVGITATLDSRDPIGIRYEFYDNTGNANPNFTLQPNGGKTITGPGTVAGASINLGNGLQGFWRVATKMSDGNWLLSGV